MSELKRTSLRAAVVAGLIATGLSAQIPSTPGEKATITATPTAIALSKQNPEAVARGGALFVQKCGGCHGATAKGTNRGPDLIRSVLVL
ncbi:MAG TPA: c-type cytochrome, partial [Bryobacteraceae bacterium]|nr:c-type cytochrome [Bryobacteraceae bacterium]